MGHIGNIYIDSNELSSEIRFLKEELNFLLKILRNAYSASIKLDKIKVLDCYWNGFESNIKDLNLLLKNLQKEEKCSTSNSENHLIDSENNYFEIITEFNKINKNIRLLKLSFYELMQGCNACSLKTNQMNYESSCF